MLQYVNWHYLTIRQYNVWFLDKLVFYIHDYWNWLIIELKYWIFELLNYCNWLIIELKYWIYIDDYWQFRHNFIVMVYPDILVDICTLTLWTESSLYNVMSTPNSLFKTFRVIKEKCCSDVHTKIEMWFHET